MKAAWATDIHLRFVDADERRAFYRQLVEAEFDVLLLTGDLGGECDLSKGQREPLPDTQTVSYLRELADALGRPIYFVLGNHDYYRSSMATVRQSVIDLCRQSKMLHFVQDEGVVALSERTALVGHECWGDTGWEDFESSDLLVNDWKVIWELKQFWIRADPTTDLIPRPLTKNDLDQAALAHRLKALGQEAAEHFRRVLPDALARYDRVIVLSHVPPFLRNFPRRWRRRPEDYLPVAVCRAAGDLLLEAARQFPDRQLRILAGHIHDRQDFRVSDNIRISIGAAELMEPCIASIFDVDERW